MPSWFQKREERPVSRAQSAAPRTEDEVKQLLRLLPRYRVLLFNDEQHTMDDVVLALVRTVPALGPQGAVRVMLQAHLHGNAEVIVCPKEQAEYYRERLEGFGLTSTIEPA
ncbi:MAG: ATP-dependent Clp protease adaptor ClpS [Ktedonobacterales bacterium]